MCGIAGLVDPQTPPQHRQKAVEAMCASMVHRGPDDQGMATLGDATVGMRRLAVFDPARGHQPMHSPDGRFTLVFNGAIYNFRELRKELAGPQWQFQSDGDTEVLLAAFARWGETCLKRLRGMFAFAIWDRQEQTLHLARDPLGIKPLYLRHTGERLLFASEINALIASGTFSPAIDPIAVEEYLGWLAVPAPRTIYQGITSLRPGESARFRLGQLELTRAWSQSPPRLTGEVYRTRSEFIRHLRIKLEDSVRAHVAADVPVGAFLSGGLDSAGVVGLMNAVGAGPLRTFSIDFDEPGFSEGTAAATSADLLGTHHHTTVITGAQVAADIEKLFATFDQPTGDGINTYYASQAARAGGVTVALSGLGGDELFGGYPTFRDTPRLARGLPLWRALPHRARAALIARWQRGDTRRRKLADVLQHAHNLHEVSALQRRVFSTQSGRALLAPDVAAALGPRSPFHPELTTLAAELSAASAEFEVVSAWEMRTYMADVLLRDTDVMSMRHSLEIRVPLVDRPLIEWLRQQSAAFRGHPQQTKSALADALRDVVPATVINRRKQGFTLPLALWMKRELRPFLDEIFSEASIARTGLLDPAATRQLWDNFLRQPDPRAWSRVWSVAVLIGFAHRTAPRIPDRTIAPGQALLITSPPTLASTRAPADQPAPPTRRTLLLAPEFFANAGGIARILHLYLRALSERQHPTTPVGLVVLNDTQLDPIRLAALATGAPVVAKACGRHKVRFLFETLRLSRECTDLICGHVFMLPAAWIAQRRYPHLRYHLVAHGIEVWRPFSLGERIALRGATTILCVSDYTRRQLLYHCPLPANRAAVLPNALDPRFALSSGIPLAECPPEILCVTRLTRADDYKGVHHLLAALPAIRAVIPAARLRVIGHGDDLPQLQARRDELGLSHAVEFTGYVDDQALQTALAGCRLFALPSQREGFGLVFLEAMSQGRPCLGAYAGGVPEVITKETGVLVEFGDVPAIAAAAIAALQRPWDQAAILARARHFSYPYFKDNLRRILER